MRDSVQTRSVRDAILDATDRLLTRFGYKKMTIDDLAQEVGIGKGSVYLHFQSKEEIALSHIDRIIERLKRSLTVIAAKPIPADERLRLMLIERVLFRFDSVQHYSTSLNDLLAYIRASLLERRKVYFEKEALIFAKVIEEGMAAGVFRDVNALETARTILLTTNSLLPYSLSPEELGKRSDIKRKTVEIAELILGGMRA
ncbi:MAG: TetR/AcrR family transcriptional regulator [Acidobacteriota bacterium]